MYKMLINIVTTFQCGDNFQFCLTKKSGDFLANAVKGIVFLSCVSFYIS